MKAPLTPPRTQQHELELIYQTRVFRINSTNSYLSIGRSNENCITVDDRSVSRKHAKIELKNSRFILTDTSTNGTLVILSNSQPIKIVRESIELVGYGWIELNDNKEENLQKIKYKRGDLQ